MDTTKTVPASPPPEDYGAEVMCASWNPVAAVVSESGARSPSGTGNDATVDADAFLTRYYHAQRT